MTSAKDELIMMYMNECMERFSGEDLKFLKEKFWMVSYNFSVCHCGGSSITSNDPSWSVKAPFNFFLARKTLAIPIAKRWDDISGTATFIKYLDKGEYTFNFINETGTSTNDTYYSTVFVSGIMVK